MNKAEEYYRKHLAYNGVEIPEETPLTSSGVIHLMQSFADEQVKKSYEYAEFLEEKIKSNLEEVEKDLMSDEEIDSLFYTKQEDMACQIQRDKIQEVINNLKTK